MKLVFSFLLLLCTHFATLGATSPSMAGALLCSTEADPQAFIDHACNAINGDYCETAVDLTILGPSPLVLQRYYNASNYMTAEGIGGWRIFPQMLLVLGANPEEQQNNDQIYVHAFTGERSGGILTYSGWVDAKSCSSKILKIDPIQDTIGMTNSYASHMNGQTNHLNNRLVYQNDRCSLTLGDGTERIYQKVSSVPAQLFGEEMALTLATKVKQPQYFRLISETLPSGQKIVFSYNTEEHLASVEMQHPKNGKVYSWMRFNYAFHSQGCLVSVLSSDEKTLEYHFQRVEITKKPFFLLTEVKPSHGIPCKYEYQKSGDTYLLTKKALPEGRFLEVEYDSERRVKHLKEPDPLSGNAHTRFSFAYSNSFTEVSNSENVKTHYCYNDRLQLTAIKRFDTAGILYRIDHNYWGGQPENFTLLLARTVSDGKEDAYSHRSFEYDSAGNVIKEYLSGNLTGKKEERLQVDSSGKVIHPENAEQHIRTFGYSKDGFNLLTSIGDVKGNQTLYVYQPKSNHLIKKFIYEGKHIRRREFRFYDADNLCVKIIEDDGEKEDLTNRDWFKEQHITKLSPVTSGPGIGLPQVIEEYAIDSKTKKELFIGKTCKEYSTQGQLLICSTYDANGQYAYAISKTYNALGLVASETDPLGQTTFYTYDDNGNLTKTTLPHQNKTIEYSYDLQNRLTNTIETIAGLQAIRSYTYDRLGRKISSTDRFGQITYYVYDAFDHLIKIIHPAVLDETREWIHPTFSYSYDIFGNTISQTDPKGYITQRVYTLRGAPSKIFYPDGSSELFKYDAEGTLHRSLTRDHHVTVYEYDYLGRVVHEEISYLTPNDTTFYLEEAHYSYNGFRCLNIITDQLTTKFEHDPIGRVTSIVQSPKHKGENHSDTRKSEIFYDALGRENRRKEWFDWGLKDYFFECTEYDLLDRVTEKYIESADGNKLAHKGFVYDPFDRCIEEYSTQNGSHQSLLQTTYDAFGEPVLQRDRSGNETKILVDYRKETLTKTIINPQGMCTCLEFDALGRIASLQKQDAHLLPLSSQQFLYDSLGNKAHEINAIIANGKTVGSQKTSWLHGPMGRIEAIIEGADSPEEHKTSYSYNSFGQMISQEKPRGETLYYTYDIKGYLCQIKDKKEYPNTQLTYFNHTNGNIYGAYNDPSLASYVKRSYNAFNQVEEERVIQNKKELILKFQYDRKGRIKKITLPDASSIAYSYDALFGKEVSRLSLQGEVLYSHTYDQHSPSGQLEQETLIQNCGIRTTQYDKLGRKTSVQTAHYAENVPRGGYDALDYLLHVERKAAFPTSQGEYTYNNLGQLTSEKIDSLHLFSYDSLDNRLQQNQEALIYNGLNQLISQDNTTYLYDPQGNLQKKIFDGEETRFETNLLSQVIKVENPDQTALSFIYDGFGRRITKSSIHGLGKTKKTLYTQYSFYIGDYELGTLDEKGNIVELRVPGIENGKLSQKSIAIELQGKPYAVLHDIQGNVCALLDAKTGEVAESYTYTAFGKERIYDASRSLISSSAIKNPWRYAEKRIDEEIGLTFFGFRFYDPAIGRWITPDPLGYTDGPNLYAYLHNNPLNYFDRFGLTTESGLVDYFFGEVEPHCYCERHRTCKRGGALAPTVGPHFPGVRYLEPFEQYHAVIGGVDFWASDRDLPLYAPSSLNRTGGLEQVDIGIGFINGIWNSFRDTEENALYLSKLAEGYNIHFVHNATHGPLVDLQECLYGLQSIATEPVKQLHCMWNSFFEQSSASARFLMVCHSQGAIHVSNALRDYSQALRERILVVAIAPAGYVYRESCAHVSHYRTASAFRDPVAHFVNRSGANRETNTITQLPSHPNAPLFDHSFQSPTYKDSLIRHLKNYLKQARMP